MVNNMMPSTITDIETALSEILTSDLPSIVRVYKEKGKTNALIVPVKHIHPAIWHRIHNKVREWGGKWRRRERLWVIPLSPEHESNHQEERTARAPL